MALKGIRVLELAGLAPAPFCGMVLSDFGANVIRVDRPKTKMDADRLSRGKKSIIIDLKKPSGVSLLKTLVDKSDVLIDPYRPGVLESMGLGPDKFQSSNPGLIFARITGYGQTGPYKNAAGHDINYAATSGVLSALGAADQPPSPPVNLLADFAGGGLLTALGICMALIERSKSGKGQVVDTSMTEGAAYVSTFLWRTRSPQMQIPIWFSDKGKNVLDGGTHFYQTYETKDGKFMAVGALEGQFYSEFLKGMNISEEDLTQMSDWEEGKEKIGKMFKEKTQKEWTDIFVGSDACVTPVVSLEEAHEHPQNKERGSFIEYDGTLAPQAAPRLSRTPGEAIPKEPIIGQHTLEVLKEFGLPSNHVDTLIKESVVQIMKSKM